MAETKKTATKKPVAKVASKETVKEPTVIITQVKSALDAKRNMKETLKSLGIHKIHQSVEKVLNNQNKGYIQTVRHLVTVEEKK
jgi:large subunit ribosomal protein L30